tara:strand:- start:1854 stop:2009 length:156 start_codon:yes stop_codon:yes gene_type:complete
LYIIQAPLIELKSKIPPTQQMINVYKDESRNIGAGIKNNETISRKILSALF